MNFVECLLLALALAMDCFSVSITCGIIQRCMGRQGWARAFFFGFFQALMPLLGRLVADLFSQQIEAYDHWIAFGLLLFIGGKMVVQEVRDFFHPAQESCEKSHALNPSSLRVIITLAFATSIDAMAVGFTFPSFGINTWSAALCPLLVIGLVSALMSWLGKYIGVSIGKRFNCPAELLGGLVLIGIGTRVLYEHLTM